MRGAGALLALGTVAVAVAGTGTATPTATTPTSVHGVVVRGPISPVCVVGRPCSALAKHAVLRFVRGSRSRSTTTDERGRYRIALAAGTYAVRIEGARFGSAPRVVVIPAAVAVARNFRVDTGIR